jgi:hypothetical protein
MVYQALEAVNGTFDMPEAGCLSGPPGDGRAGPVLGTARPGDREGRTEDAPEDEECDLWPAGDSGMIREGPAHEGIGPGASMRRSQWNLHSSSG